MAIPRSAGFLCHPTSFPGPYGIGDLGPEAYRFIDFLEASGLTLWQIFPLGPTGYGDSPYQCFSAFAGNPLLISIDFLRKDGLLSDEDIATSEDDWEIDSIDFGAVIDYKYELFRKAFESFKRSGFPEVQSKYTTFRDENRYWLNDFALFMAAKNYHGGNAWNTWENEDIRLRKPGAVEAWNNKLADEVNFYSFLQFLFYVQWHNLKAYANNKGISVVGDMPIFIAYDSSDLWANRHLFTVDDNGSLLSVAGVPPDYFSPTGQLWGNPLYRWKEMKKDDFAWWKKRFTFLFRLVDIVRIDHFRGFEANWEIPGNAPTAESGRWVRVPGKELFTSLMKELGDVPIIAEDLGTITKEVTELREAFGFPGMKILQFAFGTGMEKKFLPHNLSPNSCVLTGAHDNDTTTGYFEKAKHQDNDIFSFTQAYLNYYGNDICGELIRTAFASVAGIVVIPMQDVLGLGSEARMNTPSVLGGNWGWRFTWDFDRDAISKRYKSMALLYDRIPSEIKAAEEPDLVVEDE